MEDVLLEECGDNGVRAVGTAVVGRCTNVEECGDNGVRAVGTGVVGRCTNVEVRQCGLSGVYARNGASIILIGAKTTVHHNCTDGESRSYGLEVYGYTSNIQLVSPLTKEQVSHDNGGGGNWGP